MPNLIGNILRSATRKENEPLNIICAPTHERYEVGLAKTAHEFYAWRVLDGSIKDWNTTYAPLPANYHLLNPNLGNYQLPEWLDMDLVISANKFGQFQLLKQVADSLRLPLVSLEHTLPMKEWRASQLKQLKEMKGNLNVFISEYSRNAWGWEEGEAEVIHHGIDTEVFKPDKEKVKQRHILAVVNDWINRDYFCGYNIWKRVTDGLPVHVLGNTPGLSEPAKSVNHLVDSQNEAQVFINTSVVSPIPTALLEAMSCGTACVSTNNCMIGEIIIDGENGYITNDEKKMRSILRMLLDNPKECERIGANARKTILERFSMENFVKNWKALLAKAANINTVKAQS